MTAFTFVWSAMVALSLAPGDVPWASPTMVNCGETSPTSVLFSSSAQTTSEYLLIDTSAWTPLPGVELDAMGTLEIWAMATGTANGSVFDTVEIDIFSHNVTSLEGQPIPPTTYTKMTAQAPKPEQSIGIRVRRVGATPVWPRIQCIRFTINGTSITTGATTADSGSTGTSLVTGTTSDSASTGATTGVLVVQSSGFSTTTTGVTSSSASSVSSTGSDAVFDDSDDAVNGQVLPADMLVVGSLVFFLLLVCVYMGVFVGTYRISRSTGYTDYERGTGDMRGLIVNREKLDVGFADADLGRLHTGSSTALVIMKHCRTDALPFLFIKEARQIMDMYHDNVAACMGYVLEDNTVLYRVSMHYSGPTPMRVRSAQDAVHLLRQLSLGLHFLHSNKILHGNISREDSVVMNGTHAQWVNYLSEARVDHPWRAEEETLPTQYADLWDLTWLMWQWCNENSEPCDREGGRSLWFHNITSQTIAYVPHDLQQTKLGHFLLGLWSMSSPKDAILCQDLLEVL